MARLFLLIEWMKFLVSLLLEVQRSRAFSWYLVSRRFLIIVQRLLAERKLETLSRWWFEL